MRNLVLAVLLGLLATGCSRTDNEPGPGGVTVSEAKALDDAAAMLESRDKDYPPVMGITYTYLKALNDYDCLQSAKKLDAPLLIAQGGRDFQVTVAHDYQAWQDALGEEKDVTFKLYPKLNHLFIEGEGASYPSEYEKPGEVSGEFLDDVAAWMRGQ